jgi:hypothetical protein
MSAATQRVLFKDIIPVHDSKDESEKLIFKVDDNKQLFTCSYDNYSKIPELYNVYLERVKEKDKDSKKINPHIKDIKDVLYKHYNGKFFKGIGVSINIETLENEVVYQAEYVHEKFGGDSWWICPLEEFFSGVTVNEQLVDDDYFYTYQQLEEIKRVHTQSNSKLEDINKLKAVSHERNDVFSSPPLSGSEIDWDKMKKEKSALEYNLLRNYYFSDSHSTNHDEKLTYE